MLFPLWCSEHPVPRRAPTLSGTRGCLQAWGSPVLVLSSTAVQPLYSSPFQTHDAVLGGAAVHITTFTQVQAALLACGPQVPLCTAFNLLRCTLLGVETFWKQNCLCLVADSLLPWNIFFHLKHLLSSSSALLWGVWFAIHLTGNSWFTSCKRAPCATV